MTDLPDVKLKALISFPANVLDGTGVDVVKVNGTYQFNLAFDDFAPPAAAVTDATQQNALLWNANTGVYTLVPMSVFASAPGSALPLMNGVATVGISTLYSREDHKHPTDTTRAPLDSPVFINNPQAPTPSPGDNDTSIATTAFVTAAFGTAVKAVRVQAFTATGTYTPNANLLYCSIECWGGGAGGQSLGAAASFIQSGAGGGSGGYSRNISTAAAIGASKAVTIGAGGATAGGAGGVTSVGTLCIANGGTGSAGATVGTGNSIAAPGAAAGLGWSATGIAAGGGISGCPGAATSLGGNGLPGFTTTALNGGNATANTGSGGAGSAAYNSGFASAGGTGGSGYVVITEFCSQ